MPMDPDPIERLRKIDPERDSADTQPDQRELEQTRSRVIALAQIPGDEGRRRRGRLLAMATFACLGAVAVAGVLFVSGHGTISDPATPAFAQSAIRVAEGNPRLLVTEPGWMVTRAGEFEPEVGSIEFRNDGNDGEISINWSPAEYHEDPLAEGDRQLTRWKGSEFNCGAAPDGGRESAVLQTRTTCESFSRYRYIEVNGTRATLHEIRLINADGESSESFQVEIPPLGPVVVSISVENLSRSQFATALDSIEPASIEEWLSALPANIVRPVNRPEVVDEMLEGVPIPQSLDVELLKSEFAALNHYALGAAVSGAVACGWLDQWVAATGDKQRDPAAAKEAERALTSSRRWPILRELAPKGGWSAVLWEYADDVRRGDRAELLGDGSTQSMPDGSVYEVGPSYAIGLGCDSETRTMIKPPTD